ncbi:hypothetical protein [Actinacidiphila sp. ITFR-21]|uniref:hypothetical protein n=1 Tax=Actinacidiphila sp. ITFR-21 TaxID=3075199 RepID=UPI00288ABEED|nr:hypothetical protein [Streptomyces sp. ITFR-21]WNI17941.1 hypothetical protein RLT57_21950 [Streptomyces sp. ITFR-21]
MPWTSRLRVRQAEGDRFLRPRRRAPAIDPSFGDPRRAGIRAAAREGAERWPEIRGRLAAAAADGEDLSFLVEGLQDVAGVERWIGDVIAADPGDPLPLLVSGARHVGWAWHARTGFEARHVSEGQWELFHARLGTAEGQLLEAAEREPAWAAPWYFLQMSGRGLQVGPEVAEYRFEAVCRRAPGHAAAYRQHLQQLCRKWGGSHRQMHAFARASMLAAPEGGRLGELVALAHLEEWLSLGGDPESVYLGGARVLGELYEAAGRSVFHPAFARDRDWALAFNAFAMAFAMAGDHGAARRLFRALGNRATERPWLYLDGRSPLVPFLAWRARVNR